MERCSSVVRTVACRDVYRDRRCSPNSFASEKTVEFMPEYAPNDFSASRRNRVPGRSDGCRPCVLVRDQLLCGKTRHTGRDGGAHDAFWTDGEHDCARRVRQRDRRTFRKAAGYSARCVFCDASPASLTVEVVPVDGVLAGVVVVVL